MTENQKGVNTPAHAFNDILYGTATFDEVKRHPGLLWRWVGHDAIPRQIPPQQLPPYQAEPVLTAAQEKPNIITRTIVQGLAGVEKACKRLTL